MKRCMLSSGMDDGTPVCRAQYAHICWNYHAESHDKLSCVDAYTDGSGACTCESTYTHARSLSLFFTTKDKYRPAVTSPPSALNGHFNCVRWRVCLNRAPKHGCVSAQKKLIALEYIFSIMWDACVDEDQHHAHIPCHQDCFL